MVKHGAVFIDRDGTLIRDVGYLSRIQQIEVLPGVAEGLSLLRVSGLKTVLVTNQSAVGRGFLTETELHLIHEELQRIIGRFDGVYYCPHHPTAAIGSYRVVCDCRKPNGGMVERASSDLNLDPSASYVIGDHIRDVRMAVRVGAKGILLGNSNLCGGAVTDACAAIQKDFFSAVQWILEDLSSG
jgi:D-glycero-D-manno-heptose 1,7-bisphosphate phosphatase